MTIEYQKTDHNSFFYSQFARKLVNRVTMVENRQKYAKLIRVNRHGDICSMIHPRGASLSNEEGYHNAKALKPKQ